MKIVNLFFLCFLAQLSIAQMSMGVSSNDPFIEVKVSDTLIVNPDFIKILVEITQEETDYDYWEDEEIDTSSDSKKSNKKEKEKEEEDPTKSEIQKVINKYQLKYIYHEEKGTGMFSLDPGVYSNAFEISLYNVGQLDLIMNELKLIENAKPKIASAEVKNKHPYELILIDKIVKKGKAEAEAIAKAMGVILGNPINITNQSMSDIYSSMFNNPNSMGGMGALFSMMGNMFKNPEQQTKVIIEKSLVIRYAYK